MTVCDVSSEADTQRAVKDAKEAFGHVNVLVNNAGALSVSTVESISVEEWDRLMATNLKGPFLLSRAVLPAMRQAGGGVIVNVGSVLGLVAMKDRAAYCASKGGVTMLTKAMALDQAQDKIRVNCICPAIVETGLIGELFSKSEEGRWMRDARLATLPLLVQQLLVIQIFVFPSSYVDSLWLGSCMLFILTRGPGAFSLDYLIERYFAKHS